MMIFFTSLAAFSVSMTDMVGSLRGRFKKGSEAIFRILLRF